MVEFEGKIIGIKDYTYNDKSIVKVLKISTENAHGFDFKPGQFVMISAGNIPNPNDHSKLKFSSMSIASAPSQKEFVELCIRMPEKPGVSKYLKDHAKIGEPIKLKGPFGAFGLEEKQENAVFVATGTGIAPLIGMLRHLIHKNFAGKIFFFYGCRSSADYLYKEELEGASEKKQNFELHVSFSREEINGKKGYIQETLKEFKFPENLNGFHAYICGNPASVEQQVSALKEKGFKEENIHFEKW